MPVENAVRGSLSASAPLPILQWSRKNLGQCFAGKGCAAMNLSPELYQEITDSINVVSQDEPREADRRAPRVRLSSHLSVALWSDPMAPLSMRIRDLSQGGIGIFSSERIGLDEKVVVRFPRPDNQNVLVLGTVVYWEPLAQDLHGIGVQFDRLVEDREIAEQSDLTAKQQSQQVGVVTRLTQALARTWRVAS
jgi:PilZ domain